MTDLKNKVENNNLEILKMKDIFKNLNKNNSNAGSQISPVKSQLIQS
jgi:hypothetical protein